MLIVLFLVAMFAGAQNALAGGGSFLTLPALMLSGVDARAANIASTLALYPGQLTTGWVGRKNASGTGGLGLRWLAVVSVIGGALGAVLLLVTPSSFFERLLPWLVLFATALFAYGSFFRRPQDNQGGLGPKATAAIQFCIGVYGGYFGGGLGFMMLAALTAAGLAVRVAGATKNLLAGVINTSAVAIFVFTPGIPWLRVAVVAVGAILGGYAGALMLKRVNEKLIRAVVVVLGLCLTVGLFLRQR